MREWRYRILLLVSLTFGLSTLFFLYSFANLGIGHTSPMKEAAPKAAKVVTTMKRPGPEWMRRKAPERQNTEKASHRFIAKAIKHANAPVKRVKEKRKPTILIWIPPATPLDWSVPETEICGGGCTVTKDRKLYNRSDAVVFFMKGLDRNSLPSPRTHNREGKVYVWWCEESPWTVRNFYRRSLKEYNGYFNWTMHYKPHSDVLANLMPHTARDWLLHRLGRDDELTYKKPDPGFTAWEFDEAFAKLLKVKTKSAVAVITDCEFTRGAKQRLAFVNELERHYNVDQFGACNDRPLSGSNTVFHNIIRQYKFYFAFENTVGCHYYVTEKFWTNSLYTGCVPVVWGPSKADMEQLAPPGSYIHAEDFNYDAKRLAEFLKEVESDDAKYKTYFRWWKDPYFYPLLKLREPKDKRDLFPDQYMAYQVSAHCHLCKKLNDGDHLRQTKIVDDLDQNFFGGESKSCYT